MCSNNDEMIKFKLITLRSKSETKKRKRWCSDVMLGMGGANGPPSHPRVGEPGGNFWANASPGNLSLAAMGHAGTRTVAEMAASIRMSHTEAMACLSGSGNPSTAQTSNGWERFNGTVAAHYCTKKNCQHRFTVFQKRGTYMQHPRNRIPKAKSGQDYEVLSCTILCPCHLLILDPLSNHVEDVGRLHLSWALSKQCHSLPFLGPHRMVWRLGITRVINTPEIYWTLHRAILKSSLWCLCSGPSQVKMCEGSKKESCSKKQP